MNTLSLIVSVVAIVISVVALTLQRQSEARNLRISFLLPELSHIIDSLRSLKVKKVKHGKPDSESMTEFYVKAKDICFQKEHILKSIGLGVHVDTIINAKDHTENDIFAAYKSLFEKLDNRYQQIVGKDNRL